MAGAVDRRRVVNTQPSAWEVVNKGGEAAPFGGHVETRRYTFHAEVSLIDLV